MNGLSKLPPINIQVQTMSNCSGIFISNINVMYGWSSHSKSNQGFGSIGASNLVRDNINIVYDPDYIDTPIDDRDTYAIIQNSNVPLSLVRLLGLKELILILYKKIAVYLLGKIT